VELSRRERDLVPLIGGNLSDKQIAEILFLQPQTVKNEICALRKKLRAESRLDIVRLAGGGHIL
jgi:DNA-binding CsgD family transcriptional regulator